MGQKQNRNDALSAVYTGNGLRRLFPLPKTEDTDESLQNKDSNCILYVFVKLPRLTLFRLALFRLALEHIETYYMH